MFWKNQFYSQQSPLSLPESQSLPGAGDGDGESPGLGAISACAVVGMRLTDSLCSEFRLPPRSAETIAVSTRKNAYTANRVYFLMMIAIVLQKNTLFLKYSVYYQKIETAQASSFGFS